MERLFPLAATAASNAVFLFIFPVRIKRLSAEEVKVLPGHWGYLRAVSTHHTFPLLAKK